MRDVLGAEGTGATARGYDHEAAVLMCLLADVLDAIDELVPA